MIDEKLQEKLLSVFDKRFENYNTKVLEELGNVIKQFKDLTPTQAYKLGQQLKYNTTVKDLLNELSKISGLSVKDLKAILEKVAKENGANVTLKKFVRFETGEGLEKKNEDFAAEVAAQING